MNSVVYVLSCGDSGFFPEQCLMSLHSLRKHNPNISAYVVIDHITLDCLKGKRLDALSHYAEILSFDTPSEYNTEQLRSRFLKTFVRKLVHGDFLFLDCDTLVSRSFSFEDFKDIDIGMVADLNAPLPLSDEHVFNKCKDAGFSNLLGSPYYNSGVVFVKDSPVAFRFFELWHQLWRESVKNGCVYDQPALCEANRQLGFLIKDLPGKWNCQIKFPNSRYSLQEAIVLHYFAADGSSFHSFHEEALLKRVRDVGIDATVSAVILGNTDAIASFFCQKTDMALRYLGADMFSIFSEYPSIFRLAERIANTIKRIKRVGHRFIFDKDVD